MTEPGRPQFFPVKPQIRKKILMGGIEYRTPAGERAILNSDHLAAGRL
ncbi:MAG: hypothetical protein KAW12_10140 [Candidatus Aminicenantes bacterium]|nr:hypothetical protein [Candidatus Aminicenantes bacterium]